jgi:hypothetical protein
LQINGPKVLFLESLTESYLGYMPSRGYASNVIVEIGDGQRFALSFFDYRTIRPELEAEERLGHPFFSQPAMVVLPEVTVQSIELAVDIAYRHRYFERLEPLSPKQAAAAKKQQEWLIGGSQEEASSSEQGSSKVQTPSIRVIRSAIASSVGFESIAELSSLEARAEEGRSGRWLLETLGGTKYWAYLCTPEHLQQEFEQRATHGEPVFAEPGLVVLPEVTVQSIEEAANVLYHEGYFSHLKPAEVRE